MSCGGADLAGVHAIRTRADVDTLERELPGVARVVVIGSGYIGLEAAAVLTKLGKQVAVLEALDRVLARVAGEPLSRFYEDEHRAHGVDVQLGVGVDCLLGDGRVRAVRLADGSEVPADMVVVGIGIVPAVQPLIAAGAGGANGVDVDGAGRTSLSDVFAIGDCAAHENAYVDGARIRLGSVQNANDQGTLVAKTIVGQDVQYDAVPWFWSNQYDLKLQTVGLSTGYDALVTRGDVAARSFALILLKQGRVIALDCVNATRDPDAPRPFDVINPATERLIGTIALGNAHDVDRAVKAAQVAFPAFARTTRQERIELLEAILAAYRERRTELALVITEEMGAPALLAQNFHAMVGNLHLKTALKVLHDYPFERQSGSTLIVHEPIGVCALITPWNWPINQIAAKVAPALACGCTVVLKPSELSPYSAQIRAEVMHAAGVPSGVFNMIQGTGPEVGAALRAHPGVAMVSFTGSAAAGIDVARKAAPTIKRVHQELGGKSPNILLPDADIAAATATCVRAVMSNSGQSCNAPTRLLVPVKRMDEAKEAARISAAGLKRG